MDDIRGAPKLLSALDRITVADRLCNNPINERVSG